jgi:hypothetical protein
MANEIIYTDLRAERFVAQTSRYIDSKVLYYGPQHLITFNTYKRRTYPPNAKDRFMIITKNREYRPDLVSFEEYGTVSFWWKIMEANGMKDILEFEAGKNIRLPGNVFF